MLEKTNAIVIKTTKYSESSLVVKAFTEKFGLRTYMIHGVRKKKSKTPMNLFQTLSILEMVVYEKNGRDIQNVKEIKISNPYQSIHFDFKKTSIAVFLNEIIYKAIGEEETNSNLFQFIVHSLLNLDRMTDQYQNFHLWFLLQFSRHLGFEPSSNYTDQQSIFDLQEGRYTSIQLPETISIHPPLSPIFFHLSQPNNIIIPLNIDRVQRKILLTKTLQFYQYHLPNFSDLKSLSVLEEIMG